jgi:hypothetical protein
MKKSFLLLAILILAFSLYQGTTAAEWKADLTVDENLEPGFYDKSGVKIHDLKHALYPDIERVMVPDLRGNGRNIFESKVDDLPTGTLTDDSNKIHHYYRFNDQVCTNRDYVNQAVSMEDPDALLEWSIGVGNQVVAIELSGIRRVAIMPMRV